MTYEQAIEMGGKEWQGKRVYFTDLAQKAAIYGITVKGKDGYTADGEKISRGNLHKIHASQPYFDVATGQLCGLVTTFAVCAGFGNL